MGSQSGSSQLRQSIQRLTSAWEGRAKEIASLVGILGVGQPAVDIFVFGGRCTGKTAIVRAVLRDLGLPHVFLTCRAHAKPGQLLQAIANGLQRADRAKNLNFTPEPSSSKQLAELISELPNLCPADGGPCYIVLDDANRLAQNDVLAPLLRLRELSGGCNVGVILISSVAWEAFPQESLAEKPPLPVLFRGYDEANILEILLRACDLKAEDRDLYKVFLRSCIPPFMRCTKNLRNLHRVASQLFKTYTGFVSQGIAAREEAQKLHKLLKPHIQSALESFQAGAGILALPKAPHSGLATSGGERLDFELPYMSKFLLVAAYIASRNKPATDKRMFDMSGGRKGKRRRTGPMQADKQAEAAKAAALAGPSSFDLERLLAIFWHILGNEDGSELCQPSTAQSSEIFMQISSLVSLRLLSQVTGEDLLDRCKYRCNISDELASRVAKNLQVDLSKYLVFV